MLHKKTTVWQITVIFARGNLEAFLNCPQKSLILQRKFYSKFLLRVSCWTHRKRQRKTSLFTQKWFKMWHTHSNLCMQSYLHCTRRQPRLLSDGRGRQGCETNGFWRGVLVTFGLHARPALRGQRMLVVVGIFHLLTPVRQVAQDAHAVLDALVADVGLVDGRLDHVQQRVHQALVLTQLLPRVFSGWTHIS